MKRLIIAAALLCVSFISAEARPRHHIASAQLAEGCNVLWPCIVPQPFKAEVRGPLQPQMFTRKKARPETVNTFGRATVFGSGIVRSVSGATAHVSSAVASKFQCLVNALDSAGYPIKFMGGFGKRPNNYSKHPSGNALDINQTGRDIVIHRFPAGVNGMADSCGLFHGSQWRNADTGHFEVPGVYATAPSGRHRVRYAHRRHHRYASAVR